MAFDGSAPTAASIAEVRRHDAKQVALTDYCRRPEVAAERRSLYRIEPPAPIRHATEAEIMEIAAALDRGEPLNPRLWVAQMTVSRPGPRLALKPEPGEVRRDFGGEAA